MFKVQAQRTNQQFSTFVCQVSRQYGDMCAMRALHKCVVYLCPVMGGEVMRCKVSFQILGMLYVLEVQNSDLTSDNFDVKTLWHDPLKRVMTEQHPIDKLLIHVVIADAKKGIIKVI